MGYNSDIVPVIMFHSVGLSGSDWVFSHISEPLKNFEAKLDALARKGCHTIHWSDLFSHMSGTAKLPHRTIMLTFDDGYLDNWVYVFPLIKRYGIKVTIFVSPEFVDPNENPRPTLEDVWSGRIKQSELQTRGFLCWEEMRAMSKSGLVDIQSHAFTHTWYFAGPKVMIFIDREIISIPGWHGI